MWATTIFLLERKAETNSQILGAFFYCGVTAPSGPGPPHSLGFYITQWHTTVSRTSLDEWLAHCRDLYLTTHNTQSRQTDMPLVGFKPTISAGRQPQTYALDCGATGTSTWGITNNKQNVK